MQAEIRNGRINSITKAGDENPTFTVNFTREHDDEVFDYKYTFPLDNEPESYVGKYLQVRVVWQEGKYTHQEGITDEKLG